MKKNPITQAKRAKIVYHQLSRLPIIEYAEINSVNGDYFRLNAEHLVAIRFFGNGDWEWSVSAAGKQWMAIYELDFRKAMELLDE